MIVKNVVIRQENHKLIVDVKDADMKTKKLEQKMSIVIDTIIEEVLKNDETLDLVNFEKI